MIVFDVGNTDTVVGFFQGENLINKLKLNSIIFSLILLLQSILHVYISFKSYNFYQNTLKQVYNFNVRLIVIQVSIVLIGKTI